ncbi:MAG: hypothetical protein AAF840_10335 [Bacteroidota bacterium]
MESIFHAHHLQKLAGQAPSLVGDSVQLRRQHLWLSASIVQQVFANERQVYAVYYPQRGALLLASMSDDAFKSLHDCSLVMLKDRTPQGDKSLSLQEIIIDHDLNTEDRSLSFSFKPGLALLQVMLQ